MVIYAGNAIITSYHTNFAMDREWDVSERVLQRLRLQDVRILMAVVHAGSMSKAAQSLNTTQPAISRSIAELEHTLGIRLLDRSRRGVEPTKYGRALLDGGAAVFDELRQAIKNIQFLSDPTLGEIRIGGNEAIIAGLLAAVYGRLRRRYPGIAIHVTQAAVVSQQYRELRNRNVDFILGRISEPIEEDIAAEVLFYDRTFVVAAPQSKWSRHRKIELTELAEEAWGLPPAGTLIASLVADAFRAK